MSIQKNIIKTMKLLYKKNYITMRDGNISFKPKNKDFFYLTAGSVKKNELQPNQIIKINFDKNKNINYNLNDKYLPSREINIHSFIQMDEYYKNQDIYVVHAHPPNIISYMGINQFRELNTIKEIFPELNVDNIGKNVKYFEPGTLNLANSCYENLIKKNIIGMEKHGTLSVNTNIDLIMEELDTLESYIKIVLNSS